MPETLETPPQLSRKDRLLLALPERMQTWKDCIAGAKLSDITRQRLQDALDRRKERLDSDECDERTFIDMAIRDIFRVQQEATKAGEDAAELDALIEQLRLDIWRLHQQMVRESRA